MPETHRTQVPRKTKPRMHEPDNVDIRAILIITAALALLVVAAVIIAGVLKQYLSGG